MRGEVNKVGLVIFKLLILGDIAVLKWSGVLLLELVVLATDKLLLLLVEAELISSVGMSFLFATSWILLLWTGEAFEKGEEEGGEGIGVGVATNIELEGCSVAWRGIVGKSGVWMASGNSVRVGVGGAGIGAP